MSTKQCLTQIELHNDTLIIMGIQFRLSYHGDPVQALEHGGFTYRGSVGVIVTNKYCLSALDLLQCVDVTFGMRVLGIAGS